MALSSNLKNDSIEEDEPRGFGSVATAPPQKLLPYPLPKKQMVVQGRLKTHWALREAFGPQKVQILGLEKVAYDLYCSHIDGSLQG